MLGYPYYIRYGEVVKRLEVSSSSSSRRRRKRI